jgi:hypothetical protein
MLDEICEMMSDEATEFFNTLSGLLALLAIPSRDRAALNRPVYLAAELDAFLREPLTPAMER